MTVRTGGGTISVTISPVVTRPLSVDRKRCSSARRSFASSAAAVIFASVHKAHRFSVCWLAARPTVLERAVSRSEVQIRRRRCGWGELPVPPRPLPPWPPAAAVLLHPLPQHSDLAPSHGAPLPTVGFFVSIRIISKWQAPHPLHTCRWQPQRTCALQQMCHKFICLKCRKATWVSG